MTNYTVYINTDTERINLTHSKPISAESVKEVINKLGLKRFYMLFEGVADEYAKTTTGQPDMISIEIQGSTTTYSHRFTTKLYAIPIETWNSFYSVISKLPGYKETVENLTKLYKHLDSVDITELTQCHDLKLYDLSYYSYSRFPEEHPAVWNKIMQALIVDEDPVFDPDELDSRLFYLFCDYYYDMFVKDLRETDGIAFNDAVEHVHLSNSKFYIKTPISQELKTSFEVLCELLDQAVDYDIGQLDWPPNLGLWQNKIYLFPCVLSNNSCRLEDSADIDDLLEEFENHIIPYLSSSFNTYIDYELGTAITVHKKINEYKESAKEQFVAWVTDYVQEFGVEELIDRLAFVY